MPQKLSNYYHLNSSEIARIPLICEFKLENCSQKKYAPHNFYEDTITFNGRDAIFVLQKQISNRDDFREIMGVIAEMGSANVHNIFSKDKSRIGYERFESRSVAEELFRKYSVPQNLIGKLELSIAHALYHRFAETATITVPGYVTEVSVNEFGVIVSQIENVPAKERSEIERKVRSRNFRGPLNFWQGRFN